MANLKNTEKKTKAQAMGMHTEVLTGRTQQKFFNPDEAENFYYFGTYDVDFNKRTNLDVKDMTAPEANKEIDDDSVLSYIKNRYNKDISSVDELFETTASNGELPEDVATFLKYKQDKLLKSKQVQNQTI